ncbi:MAG: outer membrane beta-barrel protein, partial [Pseudoalteromonas sp.]
DYEGVQREDDSQEFSIALVHSTARWLEISIYGTLQDKNSNLEQFKYDKTLVGFNFKISM